MLKEYIESIRGKRASVIGIGVSNTPLIRLLAEGGIQVTAHDKKLREQMPALAEELEAMGVRLVLGPDYLQGVDGDVVFRTPGLRPDVPALRVVFEGGREGQPIMAGLVKRCGVDVNILSADIKPINGQPYGQMLIESPDDPLIKDQVIKYLREQGLTVKEVLEA